MVRFRIWERDGKVRVEGLQTDFDDALQRVETLLENENPSPMYVSKIQIERAD